MRISMKCIQNVDLVKVNIYIYIYISMDLSFIYFAFIYIFLTTYIYLVPQAILRQDLVTEGNCPEQILANASIKHGYYFEVPKVLED